MRIHRYVYSLMALAVVLFVWLAYAYELPKWFPFNTENALEEWQEKIFYNRVLYIVDSRREGGYLSAQSEKACSGLMHKIRLDPKENPMISWRWRVIKFPKKGREDTQIGGWIERDDYAARVYVIFGSWNLWDIKSLEYIWAEDLKEGMIMSSPYFDNLKLIVVESGKNKLNQWVFEERNICEDYKKAFNSKDCYRKVTAIALMTDSDNTISTAEAFYKNIKVGYKNE